jgi:hypothetical protein
MNNINFCKALNASMERSGISNVWLGNAAGISDQALSNFRTGKSGLKSENLERVISALPADAREYFFDQLNPSKKDLRSLILRATTDEKAEILQLVAASLRSGILSEVA